MLHRPALIAATSLSAAFVPLAAAPAAEEHGRLDREGSRLVAADRGDRVCLILTEPREGRDLRLRRCLLPAAPRLIRSAYVDGQCEFGTRLFGIAPRGTRTVNLGSLDSSAAKPISIRAFTIPRSVHPAGGVGFVVRRSVAGLRPTVTAYDAAGKRLAQRTFGPYAIAGCSTEPQVARPD